MSPSPASSTLYSLASSSPVLQVPQTIPQQPISTQAEPQPCYSPFLLAVEAAGVTSQLTLDQSEAAADRGDRLQLRYNLVTYLSFLPIFSYR